MGELKDIITGRQSSKKYRKDNFSNSGARSGDLAGRNLEPQHNSEMTIRKIVSGETEDTTGNNDTGKTSLGMTVNEMFNIINHKKNSNNTSSSTSSNIKSFFNENMNKANSSAEDFRAAIKNPNKSLNDRVKGLTHMYNAAVATGDTKTAEKMQKEYDELADRVNKQTEINRQNAETAEAENAKLAEQANKEQKYADKYKNSTLEQRKNARIHATTEELDWLNKHMYDNSSSKELEDYNNQLNKEANSLWNQRDEEQAYNRLKAIEDEQGKLKTAIDNAKLSEQKKKEYDDIVDKNVILKTVMQKYYALQHYDDTKHMLASTGHDTDSIKNQVTLDDYNYINKLSDNERIQIEKDFKNLKKEGYDTESLYKWYERERDAEKAAETTRTSTEYADEHPVLGSIASVGARLGGAVPDAIKYISTDLDKKYNGGDGYINPEATNTAISDAMRAKVSENINNDFGSFLYNTGMSMADFASLLPLNAVPGGQALSLGIMGTSAGVGAANEVIKNGGTIDNAVKTGIASGIAETLFEKVSLEQLSAFRASGKSTFRAAVGNVLKGAFTEGSEEAFTDLANRLTDDAINKDLSSYNLAKKNYMEQGMNESEAENAASWDFWKNVGLDFAGGAISGGVLNLATAGINLAGAKIDMAQNKESNAQIGKAVMADENFDLDLLIRRGLATEKNDKAYNYAKHMQKLVENDNEGKISAGDVGNLMYLINREVAKNPKLVNKIAQVKKQNTQEQSNKTVNVQNEQNHTQQNTAQNGQQNAEQAQASTAINATKKADTEDIAKMYGVYAFGKNHPNGIIATDTSTGKVVKVALKSLESSAKINRNDEENTLVFNTNDGKQVNADSITFSDSQLDAVVHRANEFDTYGARNYISNFEEWRESPQAQKMSDEEQLYKYNNAYSAAYNYGREGVKFDTLKQGESSNYRILNSILGENIIKQAMSAGRRDVDINTQHHANRLTELINRNGRADTSGVSVYADSGTDVSHIPQELISVLGNLATKTGRNIVISDRLTDGVNGVARDGNIILSSEISSQKILATALHEAGHMIKKTNPTEWQTLSDFVSDYLVRKGVDLNKMIDRTIERYGNRLQADEHENTRDAALEEIVCDTLMSIASDEKALNIALSTKQNKAKIAAAIKSLIAKVKDWLIDKSKNYGAKAFAKDLEALENLAKRFSEAADTAKENITEQTEVQNGEKIDVEKSSLDEDYDSKDEKAGAIHDTLNFSIDDEYDDLFDFSDNGEQHIDFDKAIDKNNPELTIEQIYHHSARNVKEGLRAGKGIKPEQKKIYNMVKSVMRSYHINPNAETDSLITEYVDALNTFIDSVQNDKSNFTDAFESFVLKCREALQYSTQLDEQHEAWAKEIRDELRGTTLLIPENAIDTIKENYGSVGKYKKALFGKINVKLEHNAKGINGNAVGSYIEDIGSHLENIGGRSLMIEDGFEWDSDSGYRMLDHIMNYVLAPQYVATYDGKFESESTIDAAAIQMAFDTTAEYLKQQGKAAVMQNNIDKKRLRDINKALRQAEKAKTALNQKTIENYKTDIAEQKAKYNEQREKYRQAYNALKDTKSEQAKKYRDKIHELEELSKNQKAIIKTVKDTFRAQYIEKREQTKYMQMLGKKFDKLVKKFDAKSKNTENIPESLKRPILNVLIGFKESADPGQYKNGNQKTIPKYFGAWNNVAEIGEQVRNLYEEYKSLAPESSGKDKSTHEGMQYSYIDINSIAYDEQTAKMLEIITDQFAEYATDENGETKYDADGKPIKVGYKNIFDLDSSDLRLLYDTMTALEASLTQATEIIVNGQRESIASAAEKALDEIANVNYNKDVNINVLSKNTVGNKINAALSDMKELSNRFVATSLDPVRYGRFLSGYNDDSIVAKLFKDLHDGDVKREKIMQKAYTKVQSFAYQYSEKDLAKIQKNDVKEFDFRDTETGERVKVSQGIIMSIYLTDQQSSGRRHLLADRLNHYTVLPDLDSANSRRHSKQEKAKSENHHKVRFTFEDLQHIKRYVESNKMLREISGAISEVLNNELSQEINEVSMSKYGMLIATVRNYFPISVYGDGAAYEKDFSAEFNDLRMKSRGFIKRRESSSAPIVIDDVFRVFNRHASSVAEWCGLTTPIENFKKVYNWINTSLNGTTLHEAIMHKYGKVAEHYIDKLMGDLQKSKDTIDNNLLTRMQGNYMGAVLLLNPGAMIKQFAAFPTANAYFGTKNVAIASTGGMWKVNLEKYAEYTPYLWYRAEGNGTVVGELSKKAGVVGGLKDKIDIMGKVDRYVVGCLLKAAELHVEQTTKLKKGSDAFYKEVVRQFEKCVDETQPNNMVTSKPQFIRNNYLKILSMNAFRSQTMAIGNTIIDSYMEYRTKSNDYKLSKSAENKSAKKVAMKKFAKALIGATESALLIGGLTTLVNMLLWHKWDDERDDKGNVTAENIFKSILDYSMESFAGTFTFGDTAYSAIAHKIDNDRPFYGLDSMSLDNVNNFVENISNGKYILAATLLGDCFGFPASNIKRMALSLTSYFTDLTKGRGEIISDNKGNINTTVLVPLMINATIDGDADKAQYYEQLYVNTIMDTKGKTEKEARDMLEQKVITALSKNNDDVEKAAVARANGDLNTYESLINKVSSYGFGKDDVIKASDKVISNIIANMKKEGITDEDDAKSDLVDNQGFTEQGAEYIWKKMSSSTDDEKSEESIFDSTGNDDALMYKYTDAFEYLKNGDTANYEKVEKYLMEHKGKTKNQMKKLMQSASRTDPIFKKYIEASKNNDADTTHTLYRQLLNIYGSESKFKSALKKYQDKVKKQQSK